MFSFSKYQYFIIGVFPFLFLVSNFLVAFAGYNLNIQTPAAFAIVAALLSIVSTYVSTRYFKVNPYLVFICILGGFIGAISISLYFYDLSFDGEWYHQRAVYRIANGWNPYTDASIEPVMYDNTHIILNHYARASWIAEANIYALTGRIESAKMYHLFCIWGQLFLSYFALLLVPKLSTLQRLLIAIIIAFNPVSLNQSISFYQDGLVSSLYIALALLLFIYIQDHKMRNYTRAFMVGIIWLIINIKLIALAFCGIIAVVLGGVWLLYYREKNILKDAFILCLAIVVAVSFFGYRPYVNNQMKYGHILYPLNKAEFKTIWLDNITPISFRKNNRFENIWYAMFIDPSAEYAEGFKQRKLPFGTGEEWGKKIFSNSAPKVLGWGFWFGEAVILSAILMLCLFIENRKLGLLSLGLGLLLLCTIFCIYYTYQARYVPQAFLWAIIPLFAMGYIEKKWIHLLGTGLIIILLCNSGILGYYYFKENAISTHIVDEHLAYLVANKLAVVLPENEYMALSEKIKYEEHLIPTRWVSNKSNLACESDFLLNAILSSPRCLEKLP